MGWDIWGCCASDPAPYPMSAVSIKQMSLDEDALKQHHQASNPASCRSMRHLCAVERCQLGEHLVEYTR